MAAPTSAIDICNRALKENHHLDALPSDALTKPVGKAAILCSTYYDDARREILRMGPWTCVAKRLALASGTWSALTAYAIGDRIYAGTAVYRCTTAGKSGASAPTWPSSGTVSDSSVVWTYQYATAASPGDNYTGKTYACPLPADYINQIEVTDAYGANVGFIIEAGILFTDDPTPVLVYVPNIEDVTKFDPMLAGAIVFLLASKIAYPMGGSRENEMTFAQIAAGMIPQAKGKTMREKKQGPAPAEPWYPGLFG